MKGIRAFGQNTGGLNHIGDFELLFKPVIPQIGKMAVFGAELKLSNLLYIEDEAEAGRMEDEVYKELERLSLFKRESYNEDGYHGPGFFPKFAKYLLDDWNDVLCFSQPFPKRENVINVMYSNEGENGFKTGDYSQMRKAYMDLDFSFFFQNIDACYWECYAKNDSDIELIVDYLKESKINYEELLFSEDFPHGGLKEERSFSEVREIWEP